MRSLILMLILISGSVAVAQQLSAPPTAGAYFVPAPGVPDPAIVNATTPLRPGVPRYGDVPVVVGQMVPIPVIVVPPPPPLNIPFGSLFGSLGGNNRPTYSPYQRNPIAQPPDSTEAGFSAGGVCSDGSCSGIKDQGLNGAGINDAANQEMLAKNPCMQKILVAARTEAKCWENKGAGCAEPPSKPSDYANEARPLNGNCGRAVASALTRAGINDGSKMGDAKDMGPALQKLGFENEIKDYKTPNDAPVGAIMVYGPATRPGCDGAGSTAGHVEFKDVGGKCVYDGTAQNNIQVKFGADCRPLIGVYIPKTVRNCG